MTDRNRMLQGNTQPVAVVGAISGKGIADTELMRQFKLNSINPRIKPFCYPGGEDPINNNIMQYDTVIGMRNVREIDGFDGEPAELAIAGLGGLNWAQYCSQRAMQDDYYWIGIVTTESRLYNPYDPGTEDAIHQGFGFVRAGTHTVPNNGGHNFYPGQRIRWRFPLAPFHPKSKYGTDNDMPVLNELARAGRPPSQWQVEYVPFDPLDMTEQIAAAYATMTAPLEHGGISDLKYTDAVPSLTGYPGERPHECIQEEAASYKYGLTGVGLAFVNALADRGVITINDVALAAPISEDPSDVDAQNNFRRCAELAKKLGLWDTTLDAPGKKALHRILAEVFLNHLSPLDESGQRAEQHFETAKGPSDRRGLIQIATSTPEDASKPDGVYQHYANLRVHTMSLLLQGICGSWDSAHNSVVGRALNASAPGDDLHGLWGYHV